MTITATATETQQSTPDTELSRALVDLTEAQRILNALQGEYKAFPDRIAIVAQDFARKLQQYTDLKSRKG